MPSKKKFFQCLKESIKASDVEELYDNFFKMDHFSVEHLRYVLECDNVPNKDYLDYCFYIGENFSSLSVVATKSQGYLYAYMSVLYLYCSSKCEGGSPAEIDSLYVRLPIQTFCSYKDNLAASYYYHFLGELNFQDICTEYFILLGQLMLIRCFECEKKTEIINKKIDRAHSLKEEIESFFNATSSVDCYAQWSLLNKNLPKSLSFSEGVVNSIFLNEV